MAGSEATKRPAHGRLNASDPARRARRHCDSSEVSIQGFGGSPSQGNDFVPLCINTRIARPECTTCTREIYIRVLKWEPMRLDDPMQGNRSRRVPNFIIRRKDNETSNENRNRHRYGIVSRAGGSGSQCASLWLRRGLGGGANGGLRDGGREGGG